MGCLLLFWIALREQWSTYSNVFSSPHWIRMLGLLISDLSVVLCVLVMLHLDPDFGPDFHVTAVQNHSLNVLEEWNYSKDWELYFLMVFLNIFRQSLLLRESNKTKQKKAWICLWCLQETLQINSQKRRYLPLAVILNLSLERTTNINLLGLITWLFDVEVFFILEFTWLLFSSY